MHENRQSWKIVENYEIGLYGTILLFVEIEYRGCRTTPNGEPILDLTGSSGHITNQQGINKQDFPIPYEYLPICKAEERRAEEGNGGKP